MAAQQRQRWTIRVTGVVQGVGYRPFVYRIAREHGLAGWVLNDPQGVLLEACGEVAVLQCLTTDLSARAPELARVDEVTVTAREPAAAADDSGFVIIESRHDGEKSALVPADTHVCDDCAAELRDPADRRYRYPFINCTNCGPRYSIVRALPYDRASTTMSSFLMCPRCEGEYRDPADRRYHAQPNACFTCGPKLLLTDGRDDTVEGESAVWRCVETLASGGIAAIKSVGGFHLAVDATNPEAVARLRKRKQRDSKPFAVMVRDLETAHRLVWLSPAEVRVLTDPARPILLARKREATLPDSVAPRNPNLGVMLPSAPHHHLLLDEPDLGALVMTSGNVSGYPIAYRNEDALAQLPAIADVILYHDRDIETRVDDSVVRLSCHSGLTEPLFTFLRRARGYAPYPVDVGRVVRSVVAYGAELKTTVALSAGRQVYLSQHIGDLKNDETFRSHRRTAAHLAALYDLDPERGVYDLHPQFRSRRAEGIGESGAPEYVQHHHAHMAACMAEHQLTGPTIGVIFDGAGYGTDDTIWGGEFLVGDYAEVTRAAHLRYLPLIGGDQAVREPVRVAFALAVDAFGDVDQAVRQFPALRLLSEDHRHVYATMAARGIHSPPVSSMGRLFDGVAALTGLCPYAEYEAQGPIELEGLLARELDMVEGYTFDLRPGNRTTEIDPRPVIRELARDLSHGQDTALISRRFHAGVVAMVVRQCRAVAEREPITQVVLSGGVFLNEFLLVNCVRELRQAGFSVACHRQVPTNDGGIALGQVMVADARISRQEAR